MGRMIMNCFIATLKSFISLRMTARIYVHHLEWKSAYSKSRFQNFHTGPTNESFRRKYLNPKRDTIFWIFIDFYSIWKLSPEVMKRCTLCRLLKPPYILKTPPLLRENLGVRGRSRRRNCFSILRAKSNFLGLENSGHIKKTLL